MIDITRVLFSLSPFELHTIDGGQASEGLLRECWEFRLSIIGLRPEVSRDTDWIAFRSYFHPGMELLTVRARDGQLLAIFGWSVRTIDENGQKHAVIDAEYGFIHRRARNTVIAPLIIFRVWMLAAQASRSPTIHMLGGGYPTGMLGLSRGANRIVSLNDSNLAPWERRVMIEYCAHSDCIDSVRGIVRMRTRPMEGRRIPRSEKNRQLLAWYEAQVPNWQEGVGLVMLFRIDPVNVARSWIGRVRRR